MKVLIKDVAVGDTLHIFIGTGIMNNATITYIGAGVGAYMMPDGKEYTFATNSVTFHK